MTIENAKVRLEHYKASGQDKRVADVISKYPALAEKPKEAPKEKSDNKK